MFCGQVLRGIRVQHELLCFCTTSLDLHERWDHSSFPQDSLLKYFISWQSYVEVYTAVTHTCPHLEHEICHESEGQRIEKMWEMWEKCFNLWTNHSLESTLFNNKSISRNCSSCFVQKKKIVHRRKMCFFSCCGDDSNCF